MNRRVLRCILKVIIVLTVVGLLGGCTDKSNIQSQSNGMNSDTELSKQEADLIGVWHAMPSVAAGYAERIAFYKDRTYIYIPNSNANEQDDDFGIGKWSIKEKKLYLIQEKTSDSRIVEQKERVLDIGNMENENENEGYPYKISIGKKYYWKISDDPEFGMEDINKSSSDSKSTIENDCENKDISNDNTSNKFGSTAGNINNGGLFATLGKWIFYQNIFDGNKLYKTTIDGGNKVKITGDVAHELNIVGEWLYYTSKESRNLFKIGIDGENLSMLTDNKVHEVRVAGDWVYYLNELDKYSLYRIKVDGSNEMKLFDGTVSCYDISGDWIYLTNIINANEGKLFKIKLDGSETVKISDDILNNLSVEKKWIIYSNPNDNDRIYKISIEGTEKTKITDDSSTRINVQGEWIYYIDSVFFYINKIKLDGTNKLVINKTESENLHIFNDYIYYDEDKSGGNSPGNPQFSHFRLRIDGSDKIEIK